MSRVAPAAAYSLDPGQNVTHLGPGVSRADSIRGGAIVHLSCVEFDYANELVDDIVSRRGSATHRHPMPDLAAAPARGQCAVSC